MLNIILTGFLIINSATLHSAQKVSLQTDDSVRQRAVITVDQLPDQIRSVDEPAIRIFLRLRLANYLLSKNVKEIESVIESIIADALNDMESYEKDLPEFSMTGAFTKVDEVRVPEMALAAIKVINNIPQPKIEDKPDSDSRKAYRKSVLDIAWSLVPIFQHMVVKDEIGTFNLASGLQRPEFKATALFGAATGIRVTSKDTVQKAKQ